MISHHVRREFRQGRVHAVLHLKSNKREREEEREDGRKEGRERSGKRVGEEEGERKESGEDRRVGSTSDQHLDENPLWITGTEVLFIRFIHRYRDDVVILLMHCVPVCVLHLIGRIPRSTRRSNRLWVRPALAACVSWKNSQAVRMYSNSQVGWSAGGD